MIPPIKLPNNGLPLWLQQKLGIPGSALSASVPQAPRKSDTVNDTAGRSGGGSSVSSQDARPWEKEASPAKLSISAQDIDGLVQIAAPIVEELRKSMAIRLLRDLAGGKK